MLILGGCSNQLSNSPLSNDSSADIQYSAQNGDYYTLSVSEAHEMLMKYLNISKVTGILNPNYYTYFEVYKSPFLELLSTFYSRFDYEPFFSILA